MHVFSKRSFLCRHIAGIGSIFLTGFLPGICSKFLPGFLPKFLVHIPGRFPARNLVQIPGRIPANLNISLQIPQGVHTDSCRNLYKKNQIVKGIPARNLVSFSCGNTAVFLLDNFVRAARVLTSHYTDIFQTKNHTCTLTETTSNQTLSLVFIIHVPFFIYIGNKLQNFMILSFETQ